MKAEPTRLALDRAIAAMQQLSQTQIQALPLLDCSLILHALPAVAQLASKRMHLAGRLQHQLEFSWIQQAPLADLFLVLAALWKYEANRVTGEQLAGALSRLIAAEITAGGPYNSRETVDVRTNAHIAIFMSIAARPLPNVESFLNEAIRQRRFEETQLTDVSALSILDRACDSPDLLNYVQDMRQQPAWQTPQGLAVALRVLDDETDPLTRQAVHLLCDTQQTNGLWPGEALWRGAAAPTGSSFTTTALIIEGLDNYYHHQAVPTASDLHRRRNVIAQTAKQAFGSRAEPLRTLGVAAVTQVCEADTNFEITLMPHFFAKALETPDVMATRRYNMLGLASLYVWVAYTIYDDLIDGEGEPAKLPVANVAMRASLECFRLALPQQASFDSYVSKVFTAMDEANAWEMSHCRFAVEADSIIISQLPRYGSCAPLAARSFAHALAPMAVLAQHPTSSKLCARRVESAFRHYLIARQLNDDLHDWLQDVQAGQASYVVTAILRDMHIKPGSYCLSTLLVTMQHRFRRTTMRSVCQRILRQIGLARRSFHKSQVLRETNDIYVLLDDLELSVHQSINKHAQAKAFSRGTGLFDSSTVL